MVAKQRREALEKRVERDKDKRLLKEIPLKSLGFEEIEQVGVFKARDDEGEDSICIAEANERSLSIALL